MVAQLIRFRPCEKRDLDRFAVFGTPQHVDYCCEEFTRGEDALTILVADEDGAPVGKVHLDFETRAAEREAVLIAAAVVPELRGRGIGRALMRTAERLVRSRGYGAIVLGVEGSNPRACRLYECLGYGAFAKDEFKYLGAPVPNPGVWMRKRLEW
ncbi:MAG TPA: GNAT family N-acetyltransferase [Gaiellaceae bacterium]|nr:GNAT family N-acetyltransferase [Gaiellaceae bacterium]